MTNEAEVFAARQANRKHREWLERELARSPVEIIVARTSNHRGVIMETFTQPKITGYRQLNEQEATWMNEVKEIGGFLT